MTAEDQALRHRWVFKGVIQGVGFRPTVYRCAVSLGLKGFVRNERSEVVAEIQGPAAALHRFPDALRDLLPPAAVLERMDSEQIPLREEESFRILESKPTAYSFPPIPPDLVICPECKTELFDADNRRYLYPFITCTQCGPRYSVVEDTPFDRETTAMVDFPQCPDCLAEYTDPDDRRFHSQTNSCWSCGPTLELREAGGAAVEGDPILETIAALQEGGIVAIQGIGGFHLAVDPGNSEAMKRIRRDKERERKPFALMVADEQEAQHLCRLGEADLRRLQTPAGPILILPLAEGAPPHLEAVSHTGTLGIMLPYTPLHLLLFHYPDAEITYRHLVMTSGNLKGQPIITDPEEAIAKLAYTADLFLYHNRRIIFRTDDSVERLTRAGQPIFLRRSRGYVPRLIPLETPLEGTILAVGADLKNAPALGRQSDIYLAPYIGDLEDPVTRRDFEMQIAKILSLYEVQPDTLVYDLHPGYHSTRWALQQEGIERKLGVQHHHAHLLAVMAEHRLDEVIGLSFDGTGYGTDGSIWGGEFLQARRDGFRRLGSFRTFGLPGSEAAVLHPLRTALALLKEELSTQELERLFCGVCGVPEPDLQTLCEMIDRGLNTPLTSSLGRLFDAAAALLGLVDRVSYEGEGPIRLEGLALSLHTSEHRAHFAGSGGWKIVEDAEQGLFRVDCTGVLRHLAEARMKEATVGKAEAASLALVFHEAVAAAALEGARRMRERTGIRAIALSGGVFQNVLLNELLQPALAEAGFEVYTHRAIPPGDGCIAVGQVYFMPGNG